MFALQLPSFRRLTARDQAPTGAASPTAPAAASPTGAASPTAPAAASPTAPAAASPTAPAAALGPTQVDRDPDGLRVVPLRPDSNWPLRRARDRVSNPFRAFPYRSLYLSQLMSPIDPRR